MGTANKQVSTRKQQSKSGLLKKALKASSLALITAQLGAVATIYAVDSLRKKRVPGGQPGFPTLPPVDTQVSKDTITTYTEGKTLYRDMIDAIDEATDTVFFETYVWRSDSAGRLFKQALYRAADRGVQVYIIYDGFGSFLAHPLFKVFRKHPNLHVRRLAAIRRGLFSANLRHTGRTHRKLLVTDCEIGFVGGFNIGDDFAREWRDTHIRINGPAVNILCLGFAEFWNTYRSHTQPALPDTTELPWDEQITAAFNLPSQLLFPVRGQYLDMFRRAKHTLDITTAYFVPDREIMRALVRAARRGVRVRVLIPEYSNHILADWVARPYYGKLLEEGVEIWLYQHAMIHAKTMTADGYRSIVGTANFDRLSLMGNYEVTVQIDSPRFAETMVQIFEKDLTTARPLTLTEWRGRPRAVRVLERILRPMEWVV